MAEPKAAEATKTASTAAKPAKTAEIEITALAAALIVGALRSEQAVIRNNVHSGTTGYGSLNPPLKDAKAPEDVVNEQTEELQGIIDMILEEFPDAETPVKDLGTGEGKNPLQGGGTVNSASE